MKQKILFLFAVLLFAFQGFAQASAYPAPSIVQCNYEIFDLTVQTPIILGPQSPGSFTVNYFMSNADAQANANAITNPSAFPVGGSLFIHARVTNINDDSFDTTGFFVSVLYPFAPELPDVSACAAYTLPALQSGSYFTGPAGSGTSLSPGSVITTTMVIYVYDWIETCSDESSFTVTIFPFAPIPPGEDVYSCTPYTLPDLGQQFQYMYSVNGVPASMPIVITETSTVSIVAVSGMCTSETSFQVIIGSPELPNPTPLIICNNDGNGFGVFDLESKYDEITMGIAAIILTYHETMIDAEMGTNAIVNPGSYVNITPNQQTIYVRAQFSENCSTVLELSLVVQACTENTISGTIRYDYDNNGCTATDVPAANMVVTCTNGNVVTYAYTNASGDYSFTNVQEGMNTVSLLEVGANYTVTPPTSYGFAVTGNTNANTADFCLSLANPVNDAMVQIYPNGVARPGFPAMYTLYVYNIGNTILSGTVTITYDNNMLDFVSTNPAFASQTANTLTFNYNNLLPFQNQVMALNFTVKSPPTVVAGNILAFTANATTSLIDANPVNNTYNLDQMVVNSFDPNDITVLEGALITEEQADGFLTYMIRFQNTGSANAVNIVITNELDPKVEWSSFLPLSSSHPYLAERIDNQVTFRFNNIMLPPSSENELGSHGFVVYRVKPVANFAIGDIIYNTANIFFDFNPPIVTNTVTTQIQPLGVPGNAFNDLRMYPNPASGRIFIQCNGLDDLQVAIYDLQGKLILDGRPEISNNSASLDVSGLQTGLYVVKLVSGSQSVTKKLVVE